MTYQGLHAFPQLEKSHIEFQVVDPKIPPLLLPVLPIHPPSHEKEYHAALPLILLEVLLRQKIVREN